jgi:nucleoid-associated protein YgaU
VALVKLEITPLDKNGARIEARSLKVPFNPGEYSISKSVSWETAGSEKDRRFNAPGSTFGGGGPRQLSLKLFFDVTEPIDGRAIDDVRIETSKLAELTRIERDLGRPPVVQVTWGQAPIGSDFPFTGVVSSLTQTFVLFTSEGKPVRANVDVTLVEFLKPELDQRETDPEMTTHRVKRGDSLASIAAALYGDPSQWRLIAEANRLDDPRALEIGSSLSIPELQ